MSSSSSITAPTSTGVTSTVVSTSVASTGGPPAPTNTCPPGGNFMPDLKSLDIPHDVRVAVIPGTNTSAPWMVNCCYPNVPNLVDGCYLYCVVPANISNIDDFTNCLTRLNRPLNESRIVGFSNDAAPGHKSPTMSVTQLGVLVLVVSGISSLVFSA
ncbi:hypothetical protein Sste5346_006445 [Sporothrix stenoceras]|uniref:Uncharacterized protein n=1 Tax=Sporothrix stenoceras TaxID=5173 RepID=A0ABR3Z171_9PEZI